VNTVSLPGIELARVGVHEISTGTWVVTAADLRCAVAAYRAGVIRAPVLKLGHSGPTRPGAPALGRVTNLRLTNNGTVLVGDFHDVPKAVAAMMPKAWPQRSVEGLLDYRDQSGRVWKLIIESVALLGAERPGVDQLADTADLYGVDLAACARRIVFASAFPPDPAGAERTKQSRMVAVAAARRRRTQRTLTATKG
jgi:hypothetical protein